MTTLALQQLAALKQCVTRLRAFDCHVRQMVTSNRGAAWIRIEHATSALLDWIDAHRCAHEIRFGFWRATVDHVIVCWPATKQEYRDSMDDNT